MSETRKKPQEIVRGDEFKVPSGPYRGHQVRAIGPAVPGKYGLHGVEVVLLDRIGVQLGGAEEVVVTKNREGGNGGR